LSKGTTLRLSQHQRCLSLRKMLQKNNEGRASRTAAAAYRAAAALLDARPQRGKAGIDDGAKCSNSIGKGRG
jgi:hypothetical protein